MVIGLFNDSFKPIMDGVGVCVHNYAYWLAKGGAESYVITPAIPNYEEETDYTILRYRSLGIPIMAPYRAGVPGLDFEFQKRLNNTRFDLIHSHCPFFSGNIGLKVARRRKLPMVATFHSKYREDLRKALYFEKTTDLALSYIIHYYESADYVWVPNTATGRTLEEYGYEGSWEVMPNGSDMPIPSDEELRLLRAAGRRLIEIDESRFVFLFVGQHRWEKNVRLIIDTLKALAEQGVSYTMVFVGSGYAEKEMKRLVAQYGIGESVRFLGNISEREELMRIYAAADLFLFPSMYDNAPLVVREAAAFALPSVLAVHSSSSEGVVDGENGFLAENEVGQLVEKLRAIMAAPSLRRRAGGGARETIYLSWEQVVRRVEKRYREIIEESRTTGKPG